MTDGNTWMNALIGAAVAIVLSILPGSTIIGGAVAGYLQRGDTDDGLKVGALAGVIALVPLVAFMAFAGSFFVMGSAMGMPHGFAAIGSVIFLFAFMIMAVYSIGGGALGGLLGVYIRTETDFG